MLDKLKFNRGQAYQALPSRKGGHEREKQLSESLDPLSSQGLLDARSESNNPLRRSAMPYIALALSTVLFACSFVILGITSHKTTEQACIRQLNTPSPFLDSVEYEWQMYDNQFRKESIYRGKPTAQLEKAWDDLWNYGSFNVPKSMLPALNKSDEGLKHFTPEQGGGAVGLLEAFHQIHCLNLVRQYTYRDQWDYSTSPSFEGPDELVREHVDHCIETLRINLMCVADVTPFLVVENPERLHGMEPDFNSLHKCRKWDQIVDKAIELQVHKKMHPAHTGLHDRAISA